MKWTTVPLTDDSSVANSLSRPLSAPAARSNADNTLAAQSQLRPASALATTVTAEAVYRERRPKPGAKARYLRITYG